MSNNALISIINGLPGDDRLNEAQALELQVRLFGLLSRRAKLYASGDTSLSQDDARQLVESLCFTLDEYRRLNDLPVSALLTGDAEDMLDSALAALKAELASVRRIYNAVSLTAPSVMSTPYRETVKSIGKFLDGYDIYFMAHLVPPDIDYLLCVPADETHKGIRYVADYLSNLYVENRFLKRFDGKKAAALLHACYVDYRSLPLNLFEPVAVNALGLSLIGGDVPSLSVSEGSLQKITALIQNRGGDIKPLLENAAKRLCAQFHFDGEYEREYIMKTALSLLPRMSCGELENIFISFR